MVKVNRPATAEYVQRIDRTPARTTLERGLGPGHGENDCRGRAQVFGESVHPGTGARRGQPVNLTYLR